MATVSLQRALTSLSISEAAPPGRPLGTTRGAGLPQSPFLGARLALKSRPAAVARAAVRLPRGRRSSAPVVCSAVADIAVIDDEVEGPDLPPLATFKLHGTGRRKTAVARVGLIEGSGYVQVNGMALEDYFQGQLLMIQAVKLPLSSLGYEAKYDLKIKTHGGGLNAQAGAMVMGIARALCMANQANRPPLKAQGMLRRDPRAVERKKYGLKKARKAPQFSKR